MTEAHREICWVGEEDGPVSIDPLVPGVPAHICIQSDLSALKASTSFAWLCQVRAAHSDLRRGAKRSGGSHNFS